MTELDHTSPISLLADLARHQDGMFRFRGTDKDGLSAKWKLKSAGPVGGDGVRLCVRYSEIRDGGGKADGDIVLIMGGGRPPVCDHFGSAYPITVMVDENADASRDRLDDNLRGVFA